MNLTDIPNATETECSFEIIPDLRLFLISIGALLAVIGSACNLLLLYVFICRPRKGTSLYLVVLALLDLLMCLTYLWMFAMPKMAVTFRIALLYHVVWETNVYVYTLGRITQCAIPYIIIASTADRLAWITGQTSTSACGYGRALVVALLLLTIVSLRMPTLWAMQLTTNAECDLFESKYLSATDLMGDERFKTFDIVVNCLHIIASFLILIVLNAIIVNKLRECHRAARRQSGMIRPRFLLQTQKSAEDEEKRERLRLRVAIKTTVVIISTYLACNSLHFCLFIIEQFVPTLLLNESGNDFHWVYVMLCDFVSILFVVSSTIRLSIYYKYNTEIRQQIQSVGLTRPHKRLGEPGMPVIFNGN